MTDQKKSPPKPKAPPPNPSSQRGRSTTVGLGRYMDHATVKRRSK
nr:MAG TPA: hypothetical protein [Caudoviricetes sp.]